MQVNSESQTVNDLASFETAVRRSAEIEKDLLISPHKYRVLSGDRPTGGLHVGHIFGSLENRVRLQNMGIETFILIADYQVLTDRDFSNTIAMNAKELVADYMAMGLDPYNGRTFIFPHSHVPELNQLLLPFLFLVSNPELDRNPTVKEEIKAAHLKNISTGMYTYPVHQAADILAIRSNLIPVGKDQLPHLEMSRVIARRFNNRFTGNGTILEGIADSSSSKQHLAKENSSSASNRCRPPVFKEPEALLSNSPLILGLDGSQKMSKSRNNAIMIKATEDETAALIKKAKTDSDRLITYDPDKRPEVSNLLRLISLSLPKSEYKSPEEIALQIGDGGGGQLKKLATDSINNYLAPIRKRRKEIINDPGIIKEVLKKGISKAREVAEQTLIEVRRAMDMEYF